VLPLPDRRFVTPKSMKECCLFNKGHTEGDVCQKYGLGSATVFNSWDTLAKELYPNTVHSPEWVH